MAQFLVTAQYTEPGPLLSPDQTADMIEQAVLPSFEILARWEREGRVKGGALAGERAEAFVLEAASNEEAGELLASLPFWGLARWDVRPLQSWSSTIDRDRAAIERIRQAVPAQAVRQ